MNLNDAYPSPFLKVEDLRGKTVNVLITGVKLEEIGQGRDKERKLIISFSGKEKKLVCNKTNSNTIGKLYGQETDHWIGKWITLMPREVEFQGDMVWAIRVSLQAPANVQPPPAPPTPPAATYRPPVNHTPPPAGRGSPATDSQAANLVDRSGAPAGGDLDVPF